MTKIYTSTGFIGGSLWKLRIVIFTGPLAIQQQKVYILMMNHEQNSCNFFLGMKIKFNMSKVLGYVKKNPYNNQLKPYFFKKLLLSHFWIDFNQFYTKTFGIVNIFIVYYSLCCYELFLFVHNLNTTNKNWLIFLYISTKNKS